MADDNYFYILSNKRRGIVGYFLFMIEIDDPTKSRYLINWTNKTNIAQVDLNFLEDDFDRPGASAQAEAPQEERQPKQYLVVSYKAEGINTYNVFVFDVETLFIKFWHESF